MRTLLTKVIDFLSQLRADNDKIIIEDIKWNIKFIFTDSLNN